MDEWEQKCSVGCERGWWGLGICNNNLWLFGSEQMAANFWNGSIATSSCLSPLVQLPLVALFGGMGVNTVGQTGASWDFYFRSKMK